MRTLTLIITIFFSCNVFSNNYFILDGTGYSDPETEALETFYGFGKELGKNNLISIGGFSHFTFENHNNNLKGIFLGFDRRYEYGKLSTRINYSDEYSLRGKFTFNFFVPILDELECNNNPVISSNSLQYGVTYTGCILTLGEETENFGGYLTIGNLKYSDDNDRNILNGTMFWNARNNIRLQWFYKSHYFDNNSVNYFSPEKWIQNYGMMFYNFSNDTFFIRSGLGYGLETINGASKNTVFSTIRSGIDIKNNSLYLQLDYKNNNSFNSTYIMLNFRRMF